VTRRRLLLATVLLVAAGAAFVLPSPAGAATIEDGILGRPFSFAALPEPLELFGETDQAVRLRTTASILLGPSSPLLSAYPGPDKTPDPRSVDVLADGNLLIADRERRLVAEIDARGVPVWTYTFEDDPSLVRPFSAQRFVAGGRELTLITDRWMARVFAVDESKRVVWQYGKTDEPGLGVDQLADPFYARYRAGRVLIADNNGGNRVIEVRYDDYREGAPDHGFGANSILWQYGMAGVYGSGPGQLMKPRSPQRLDNGNVLICDADAQRVIEVRASDYDAAAPGLGYDADSIVWQFGVTGEPGGDDRHLSDPTYAERLASGATLIADTNNGRILEVSRLGAVLRRWDLRTLGRPSTATMTDTSEPRAATLRPDGSLVTADTAFGQILGIGVAAEATAVSEPLDGGRPRIFKRWTRIVIDAVRPASTSLALSYSLDGGAWRTTTSSDGRTYALPDGVVGAALAYRLTFATETLRLTPTVESVRLDYQPVTVADEADPTPPPPISVTAGPYDPTATPSKVVTLVGGSGAGTGSEPGTGSGAGTGPGTGAGSAAAIDDGGGRATGTVAWALEEGIGDGEGTAEVRGYPLAAAGGAAAVAAPETLAEGDESPLRVPLLVGLTTVAAVVALIVRRAEREQRRLMTIDHEATLAVSVASSPSQREVHA
jgi:hypothetical protein